MFKHEHCIELYLSKLISIKYHWPKHWGNFSIIHWTNVAPKCISSVRFGKIYKNRTVIDDMTLAALIYCSSLHDEGAFSGPNMLRVHEWCVFSQDKAGLTRIFDYILDSGDLTVTINIIYFWVTMTVNVNGLYINIHIVLFTKMTWLE